MRELLIIIILSVSNLVFSQIIKSKQDSIESKYNIGLEFNYKILTDHKAYSTLLCFEYNKLTIKTGPIFSSNELSQDFEGFNLAGVALAFEYNPNNKARIFDFYFLTNFEYSQFNKEEETYYYSGDLKRAYRAAMGYGFDLKIYKGWYFTNSISFGVSYETLKYNSGIKSNELNFYGYFNGGIGYNLGFK